MASSCKSSTDYIDSHSPIRASYVNLYKWPESDAEFVRSVTGGSIAKNSPAVVDSYSCRQTYLRSYTFSRKESAKEKTRRCFVRVKERASLFASLWRRRRNKRRLRKKKKNNGCFVVGELKRVYCAAFGSIVRRVVTCTSTIGMGGRRYG